MKLSSVLSQLWRGARIVLRSVVYLTTVVCCVLFLASSLSPYIPPLRMTTPALMGLAFPVFLVLQVCITLYWLIRWQWRVLIPIAIVWLIGWGAVSSYLPINRSTTSGDETADRIKVLSYNVCAFGFVPHTATAPNPILQYIKSSGADIVCLQEALLSDHSWGPVSSRDLKGYLHELYPYRHIERAQASGTTLILLSKYPIEEAKRIPITSATNGAMIYRLRAGARSLTVINAHLESFRLQRKHGEEYVRLAREGDAFGLKHALGSKMGPSFRRRNVQANLLHRYITEAGRDDIIVCGDFNDTPISYTHHKVGEGLQDAFVASGNGPGFTFVSGVFVVRIDHIFAGQSFVPEGAIVDRSIKTSDHYPIATYLRWRD